jgi:hypothetical protein
VTIIVPVLASTACFLAEGCSPPSYGTLILGSSENDELLGGKVDPASTIDRFIIYLCPPDMYEAEHYEDLARCTTVEVSGETPVREFRQALQAQPSGIVIGAGPERRGTIMVVLRNGKQSYLHYVMRQNEVRLEAPPHGPQEPRCTYNVQLVEWLSKYVYPAERNGGVPVTPITVPVNG